jgi:hypothetical protein
MSAATARQKEAKEKARLLTPEFRASYPHLFKPNAMKGGKPKYSVTMLFEKDADLSPLKKAMRQAKIAKFGPDKDSWPEVDSPVVDGDLPKYADKEGYKDHWAIKASTNEDQRPGVVDENVVPITDPSRFYPGCYARAYVFAYVWEFPENSGRFGVGFILDHVQKTRDGKSFGGKKPADQVFQPVNSGDFEGDEDEADLDF